MMKPVISYIHDVMQNIIPKNTISYMISYMLEIISNMFMYDIIYNVFDRF